MPNFLGIRGYFPAKFPYLPNKICKDEDYYFFIFKMAILLYTIIVYL